MKYSTREELYFSFLNDLRASGVTNMFGAAPYLEREFCLEPREAKEALIKWMDSFKDEPEDKNVPEEEVVEKDDEEPVEESKGKTFKTEVCPVNFPPSEYLTHAYHTKDGEYYNVSRYTDKRVYFKDTTSKKFAPKSSIGYYIVNGLK